MRKESLSNVLDCRLLKEAASSRKMRCPLQRCHDVIEITLK